MTKQDVLISLKVLRGEVYPDPTGLYRQLISSLSVYEGRGEFDGGFDSAVDCLLQAGYEIDGYQSLLDRLSG